MNRRGFLKLLGLGTAGVVAAPAALKVLANEAPTQVCEPVRAYIAEYSDYANFSSLSLSSAIDEVVSKSAREMSERSGQLLGQLTLFPM